MSEMVEISRTSALELQNQLDEYKEKNRREFVDLQRQLKEKNIEVEKSRLMNIRMQDEVITHKFSEKFSTLTQNLVQVVFKIMNVCYHAFLYSHVHNERLISACF